jgi:OOP family OmpA-OmpF porin
MTRLALLVAAVAWAATILMPAGPAAAQSDPAAQALIDRLRPSANAGTRGLRAPGGEAGAAGPARAAPTPVWQAPARAAVVQPQGRDAAPAPVTTVTDALPRAQGPRDTTVDAPSVSITITFPTGSATLTPEAERALAPLGRALAARELLPFRFRVEGHTDSVGDAAQNQSLSERRAAAVRHYLIGTYGIDAGRLVAVGFGSSQMIVQTPPQWPEARNRRVQIVNIGN